MMDTRLLTLRQAAGYIGYSWRGVMELVKRQDLAHVYLRTNVRARHIRFRIADLDEFIMSRRTASRVTYRPTDPELPLALIARLLGVDVRALAAWKHAKGMPFLRDRSPESVRRAIELAYHAKMLDEFRAERKARPCGRCKLRSKKLANCKTLLYYYKKKANAQRGS